MSAAFGRLRVETLCEYPPLPFGYDSAAFGRLRVETACVCFAYRMVFSAAFGRLRVETLLTILNYRMVKVSRLRAAAC